MNTVQVILSLTADHGWRLQKVYVKNAFLLGNIAEEIYMYVALNLNLEREWYLDLKRISMDTNNCWEPSFNDTPK